MTTSGINTDTVLEIRELRVKFRTPKGAAPAVDGVNLTLRRGEALGLIGESGSGKSATCLALMGLVDNAEVDGRLMVSGVDVSGMAPADMRKYRGRHIAMIPQDALGALNPVFTVRQQLYDPLRLHAQLHGRLLRERAIDLLRMMSIPDPDARLNAYPHHLSGGMRQRVVSAIGISGEPSILIADEPTTALDVTVQAAYLEVLRGVQEKTNVGILFVTHDLSIVRDLCSHVSVMYAGKIVETAAMDAVLASAVHPYTKVLLASVPRIQGSPTRLPTIKGSPPTLLARPPGCAFHTRCWLYERLGAPEKCRREVPELEPATGRRDHAAACHFRDQAAASHPYDY